MGMSDCQHDCRVCSHEVCYYRILSQLYVFFMCFNLMNP